jgi:DNA-3-methyladenine glycosylase
VARDGIGDVGTITDLAEVVQLPATEAAPALLGWTLLVDGVGGVIVETEAYTEGDPASHTFRGMTPRNAVMFGPPGHLYVYRSYGLHWCVNVVCDADGVGAAVLLRAVRPTHGLATMRARRGVEDVRLLCSGPGRLTQALGITGAHGGASVEREPFQLIRPASMVVYETTTRIGITKAADLQRRYVVRAAGL